MHKSYYLCTYYFPNSPQPSKDSLGSPLCRNFNSKFHLGTLFRPAAKFIGWCLFPYIQLLTIWNLNGFTNWNYINFTIVSIKLFCPQPLKSVSATGTILSKISCALTWLTAQECSLTRNFSSYCFSPIKIKL